MLSKEEIARVDLVHRRAAEYLAQMQAGHIITECIVLHPDENSGREARWTVPEVTRWPEVRSALAAGINRSSNYVLALYAEDRGVLHGLDYHVSSRYNDSMERGLVMYRKSAEYLKAFSPPDPYTQSDLRR